MTDTIDVEALVAEAFSFEGDITAAGLITRLANALQRQQAVVLQADEVCTRIMVLVLGGKLKIDKGLSGEVKILANALAALDALPEGEKPEPTYQLSDALHRDWPAGKG